MRQTAKTKTTDDIHQAQPSDGRLANDVKAEHMSFDAFASVTTENARAVSYWNSLPRNIGEAPRSANCDLLEIAENLPTCFVLDLNGPADWPLRLVGTELVKHFGADMTGVNGYDVYDPSERDLVIGRTQIILDHSAALWTVNRLVDGEGRVLDSEWICLPLSNEGGNVVRILGSIASFASPLEYRDFKLDGNLTGRQLIKLAYASDDPGALNQTV